MRLRVICQKCGLTSIQETTKPTGEQGNWVDTKVTKLITLLDEWLDYDVRFCGSCWRELTELEDSDTLENECIRLFAIRDEEYG